MANKTVYLTFILVSISCNALFKNHSTVLTANERIYYNTKKPNDDRILLFSKQYYIRITESHENNDSLIVFDFGKFKLRKDSIFFTDVDTVENLNTKYFYKTCNQDNLQTNYYLVYKLRNGDTIDGHDSIYRLLFDKEVTRKNSWVDITSNSFGKIIDNGKRLEMEFGNFSILVKDR